MAQKLLKDKCGHASIDAAGGKTVPKLVNVNMINFQAAVSASVSCASRACNDDAPGVRQSGTGRAFGAPLSHLLRYFVGYTYPFLCPAASCQEQCTMAKSSSPSWAAPAIQVAAAGLGAAVAGPLGGAIGGWLGAALGSSASELVKKAGETFGEHAAEKLLDTGADCLLGQLKDAPASLASLYRDSLRLSLDSIHSHLDGSLSDTADWFVNWNTCLKRDVPLALPALQPGELVPANLDNLLRSTLERIDAQGSAFVRGSASINLVERTLPEPLFAALRIQLPILLNETFAALVVAPSYEQAWKQVSLKFESVTVEMLRSLKEGNQQILAELAAVKAKLDAQGTDLEAVRNNAAASAVKDQLLLVTQKQLLQESAAKDDWQQKYLALLAQSGPTLQDFLARGDLAGAAQFTRTKIDVQNAAQAQNYFDYGSVQELQFHFSAALDSYREAWKIHQDPKYGFRYGYMAQFQNHFAEAIDVYERLVEMNVAPLTVAVTLNNLAGVYNLTHRKDKAEEAYTRALSIHRELVKADPDAQSPQIAAVLNNLGAIYGESNRPKDAEAALNEALAIRRKLTQSSDREEYFSDLASTLNNLGSFVYVGPSQTKEAEQAFGEALHIRRELAKGNPEQYLPSVALTLMNLANFCEKVGRLENAESAYREAFSIRSKLAKANPDAYTDKVAMSLHALASFYQKTKRGQEAEEIYLVALGIRRNLAAKNSEIYLPRLAETLHGLAELYHADHRFGDAEPLFREELSIYRSLEQVSPGRYTSNIADTQTHLGVLYGDMKQNEDAEKAYLDALSIRRTLAIADPKGHSVGIATALNNLAAFYCDIGRTSDAKACCDEAELLLEPLVKSAPETCGELLAKLLWTRALLSEQLDELNSEACDFARRALAVAATEETKKGLQSLIAALCPGPTNPCER